MWLAWVQCGARATGSVGGCLGLGSRHSAREVVSSGQKANDLREPSLGPNGFCPGKTDISLGVINASQSAQSNKSRNE